LWSKLPAENIVDAEHLERNFTITLDQVESGSRSDYSSNARVPIRGLLIGMRKLENPVFPPVWADNLQFDRKACSCKSAWN
jgi:hypothetical protein